MAAVDNVLKSTVPYYSQIKKGMKMVPKEHKSKSKGHQKHFTLTEYSQNGKKVVLKDHVTVNQAAKKLYDYEATGLSPHEIMILIEREKALTRRVEKIGGLGVMKRYTAVETNADHCIICGETIPEGTQACTNCMKRYGFENTEVIERAEELRDIAGVLAITKDTDTNIKRSMESILRIADRLERKNNAKRSC